MSNIINNYSTNNKFIKDDLIELREEQKFENINNVFSRLKSFSQLSDEWDGPDSKVPSLEDIEKVINFVMSIPAVFLLPKAMLSRDGTVGLYWDDSVIYVDLQFEHDNTISIFSKDRSSGKEMYVESIDVESIDRDWYIDTLREFFHPSRDVLAA